MTTNEIKHPKGYWMGVGISIGKALGAALGPIFDNFGTGILAVPEICISTHKNQDGQTITVDGSARTITIE